MSYAGRFWPSNRPARDAQPRTDISVNLAHLARRYDCGDASKCPRRIWLSRRQSHVSEQSPGALVEPRHEAGACRGCETLAAAQSQSTCSAQHAWIAGRAQPARRFLMGKSALVVERACCRPVPNSIATYSHAASNRETATLLLVRAGQRAAHTLQLRGYSAGACPPVDP